MVEEVSRKYVKLLNLNKRRVKWRTEYGAEKIKGNKAEK